MKLNRLNWIPFLLFLLLQLHCGNALANGKLRIVATLPDLRYIAEQIGGDKVDAFAIARGFQDPHFVDAKPSFVLKLKKADLFVQVGLDLEIGWVPPLLETARNRNVYFGGEGYVNASDGISLLEIPKGNAAQLRAQGDIHIFGNPHYWLDPRNGKIMAQNITSKLTALLPEETVVFEKNLASFNARIDSAYQAWKEKIAPYEGTKIIAYHNSWPYFEHAFDMNIVGFIEPKPGIPPAPSHLVSVIKRMKEENVRIIIISPYFDDKPAQVVARRTGAQVVAIAPSVGAFPQIKTYFDLFDYNLNALIEAIEKVRE
ncbi:MAG: metal ABC transporter substrate-binding protein [bacterium]